MASRFRHIDVGGAAAVILNQRRRGFTLIEALCSSVVLAIAAIGMSGLLSASSHHAAAMRQNAMAIQLARELLEEIASKPFAESDGTNSIGPDSGENSREKYSCADDYNAYSDSTANLRMLNGTTLNLSNGEVYVRRVSMEFRNSPGGAAVTSGDFALVSVNVVCPDGSQITLSRLISRTDWSL